MDSRLIVSSLRQLDVKVSSINFAPPGSQDLLYGRIAANAAGTQHVEFDDGGFSFHIVETIDACTTIIRCALRFACPTLVWSGDGGS